MDAPGRSGSRQPGTAAGLKSALYWSAMDRQAIEWDSLQKAREYARANAPGIAGSVFLHALGFALILLLVMKAGSQQPQSATHILPVDIVQLGDETAAPPALQKSPVPEQKAARIPVAQSSTPRPPKAVSLSGKAPPEDEVEARLRGLAQLRQPDAALSLDNAANADVDAASTAPGDEAAYSLRDYIRAQAERRWSLDFGTLGKRDLRIPIHIRMKRDGTVTMAEIVDKQRFRTDAAYREIALSARNAIILSSPFSLPQGRYRETMDMVLTFDPKDTLH
jgi:hypothetical protein